MIDQTRRDPWRIAWQIATSNQWMAALLLCVAVGLILATWLPQMPASDPPPPAAYAQWLSEAQARFGDATPTIQAFGLFSIMQSRGLRVLLTLAAATLLLRLIEGFDQLWRHRTATEPTTAWHPIATDSPTDSLPDLLDKLRRRHRVLSAADFHQIDLWPWADLLPLLSQVGGLLLLLSAIFTHLWGWQVDDLLVPSGERILIPNTNRWVELDDTANIATHSPGILVFTTAQVPGVQAYAYDEMGESLALQRAAESHPTPQLAIPLTEERVFAIPEAELYIRLTPQTEADSNSAENSHTGVFVQVYRSPPGRLAQQTMITGDTELVVRDATIHLDTLPYARLTAVFNPGLWVASAGVTSLIIGLIGQLVWPARRLWLRDEEQIEGTGDLPPSLTHKVEGGEA